LARINDADVTASIALIGSNQTPLDYSFDQVGHTGGASPDRALRTETGRPIRGRRAPL
jgi:hypothetical protein